MLAILEEALDTFQKGFSSPDPQLRRRSCEADRWIGSEDEGFVFSFRTICSCLKIDPSYVRECLKRIRAIANHVRIDRHPHPLRREPMAVSRRAWRGRIGLTPLSLAR
jgi:hypothetical protein